MRPLNRDYDPALTWAGSLAIRLHCLDRAGLEAAWTSAEALQHREILKTKAPDMLRQLVAYVRDRLDELPPKEAAA